jgi:hypothetical protein
MPAVAPAPLSLVSAFPRLLRCRVCGRAEPRPHDALRRLAEGRWLECCGRLLVPANGPPVDAGAAELPWGDRRLADRCPARPRVRLELRKGGLGVGPDLAVAALDLSVDGLRLAVRGLIGVGSRVTMVVAPTGWQWEYRDIGEVRWCVAGDDGAAQVGVRLRLPRTAEQLADVAAEVE